MWFHAEEMLKTLKIWKSLISLHNLGSWPHKSPIITPKPDHSITICSIFSTTVAPFFLYLYPSPVWAGWQCANFLEQQFLKGVWNINLQKMWGTTICKGFFWNLLNLHKMSGTTNCRICKRNQSGTTNCKKINSLEQQIAKKRSCEQHLANSWSVTICKNSYQCL